MELKVSNGPPVSTISGSVAAKEPTMVAEKMPVERGSWNHRFDFIFSCVAMAIGLGNVWRFPYLCYKNGGGAFLIPYMISMFTCGIPLFFLEVSMGQYLGVSGMSVMGQFCPILKGVGYASLTMVFLEDVYYIVIVAWTLYYLMCTFTRVPALPWAHCNNTWNTPRCQDFNSTLLHNEHANGTSSDFRSPIEEFWERRVLGMSSGLTEIGEVQWHLAGFLILAWIIVYFVVWKGIHHSAKIIWFSAIFPYVPIVILLIRGVTLEGASEGLAFMVTPDWSILLTAQPWVDGGTQIFFSYGVGIGTLLALGSYNKFHHNCFRDSIIVCCVNTTTSLLASLLTFSVLGHMAHRAGVSVGNVVASGPGLAFLVYPEVVLQLPGAVVWAALFFLMLLTLGIDSQFCGVESFVIGMVDNWSDKLQAHRPKFTLAVCIVMLLLALPMVTEGGVYIFQLFDFYGASGMSLLWACFFQTIGIMWIFGPKQFSKCIESMLGKKPPKLLVFCWMFAAPAFMVFIFLFYFVKYEPIRYGRDYQYPWWGEMLGFLLSSTSMMWIPGYAIYYICTTPGSLREVIKLGLTANLTPQTEKQRALLITELTLSEENGKGITTSL